MLRSDTYFEQIPLEAIKTLVEKADPEDVSAQQISPIEKKDSSNPLKAKA
jgi:hypothetical protein